MSYTDLHKKYMNTFKIQNTIFTTSDQVVNTFIVNSFPTSYEVCFDSFINSFGENKAAGLNDCLKK